MSSQITHNDSGIELGLDTLSIKGDATKLFEALAKAQGEFPDVARTAEGQVGTSRKFKYADYATIMKTVRPSLSKHGIAVIQPLHSRDGQAVTTIILAGHGASVQASFSFKADPNPQEFGRAHTYYRRYQLQGTLGLEGDDDADAPPRRETTGYSEPKSEPKNAAPAAPKANGAAASKTAPTAPNGTSSSTAAPTAQASPLDTQNINDMLEKGRKQLGWKMTDVAAFYKEHVDQSFGGGVAGLRDIPVFAKRQLHAKMVELKGVEPF